MSTSAPRDETNPTALASFSLASSFYLKFKQLEQLDKLGCLKWCVSYLVAEKSFQLFSVPCLPWPMMSSTNWPTFHSQTCWCSSSVARLKCTSLAVQPFTSKTNDRALACTATFSPHLEGPDGIMEGRIKMDEWKQEKSIPSVMVNMIWFHGLFWGKRTQKVNSVYSQDPINSFPLCIG